MYRLNFPNSNHLKNNLLVMNRVRYFLIILGTVIVTAFIIVLVRRPELLKDFWLWIVGLAGFIVAPIKNAYDMLKEKLEGRKKGSPEAIMPGRDADLKMRISTLESELKEERDFYLKEINGLKARINDLESEEPWLLQEDLFEEGEEDDDADAPGGFSGQLNKQEILTYIKSLTRKERRKLIRDGKLPGE